MNKEFRMNSPALITWQQKAISAGHLAAACGTALGAVAFVAGSPYVVTAAAALVGLDWYTRSKRDNDAFKRLEGIVQSGALDVASQQRLTGIVDEYSQRALLKQPVRIVSMSASDKEMLPEFRESLLETYPSRLIVIDKDFANTLSDPQLRAGLAHEIVHVADDAATTKVIADKITKFGIYVAVGGVITTALSLNIPATAIATLFFGAITLSNVAIQASLARHGEYVADRGSVLLARDPGAAISGLSELKKFAESKKPTKTDLDTPLSSNPRFSFFNKLGVALLRPHLTDAARSRFMFKVAKQYNIDS